MRKVDRKIADQYFKTRIRHICVYLIIWAVVSFGVVATAERWVDFTFNGMPFHYFMGAQGSILVFIALLFINAIVSDRVDRKFGIDEKQNEGISAGKTFDH